MKKTLTALVLSLVMLCAVFMGCTIGGGTDTKDVDLSVADPSALSGEITVALQATGNKRAIFEAAIKRYNETRKNVKIKVEWKTQDNFYQSYQTDVSTGLKFPDAAIVDHIYVQSLAEFNLIANVDTVIDKSVYLDGLTKINELNGKSYGFSMSSNTQALYYNKDIIGDTPPTTYEEFKTICARVTQEQSAKPEKERYKPFTLWTGSDYRPYGSMLLVSWAKRNGGTLLSDDLKTSNINSQPVKDTLTQWKEIVDNNWCNPLVAEEALFYLGKVGMMEIGCWSLPTVFKDEPVANFGLAPMFSTKAGGSKASVLGTYTLVVTKQNDENKMKMAADFSKFLSTDNTFQVAFGKEAKSIPVTKVGVEDEYYQTPNWQVFINTMADSAARPGSSEWQYIESEVGNMYSQAINGKKTIDKAMLDCSNLVQNKLDELIFD